MQNQIYNELNIYDRPQASMFIFLHFNPLTARNFSGHLSLLKDIRSIGCDNPRYPPAKGWGTIK